jgi:hypothetical protein
MRRLLAVLFTAAPFVAASIAALSARRDLRMMWMALAATLVARLVIGAMRGRRSSTATAAALALATVAASAVAFSMGARGAVGIVMVAAVLAGCATAGSVLARRPQAVGP